MKQAALALMVFLPLMVSAQEKDSSPVQTETSSAGVAVQQGAPPASTQTQSGTAQPTKPKPEPKPEIPGSMVGYIEDGIVSSKIRIRFDDAFDDEFPDRSEFVYAKCSCYRGLQNAIPPAYDPNAPGPGPESKIHKLPAIVHECRIRAAPPLLGICRSAGTLAPTARISKHPSLSGLLESGWAKRRNCGTQIRRRGVRRDIPYVSV